MTMAPEFGSRNPAFTGVTRPSLDRAAYTDVTAQLSGRVCARLPELGRHGIAVCPGLSARAPVRARWLPSLAPSVTPLEGGLPHARATRREP
jgi:hypothetical protein